MAVGDYTLADMVAAGARSFGERPWLVTEEGRLTHRDCLARMERAARRLAGAGVGRGDRIALLAQNRAEHLDLLFAAARLGAILVEVNWRLSPDEIAHVLADTTPRVVVAEPAYAETLAALRENLAVETWWSLDEAADGMPGWADVAEAALPETRPEADDGVLVIHTAAVAGKARGALLTHRNLVAAGVQHAAAWSLTPSDVGLILLPLFHISGLGQALAVQAAGGASVLMRRFDPEEACAAIARERATLFFEFAPMLGQILDRKEAGGHDLSSLRVIWGLDSAETIARFESACPQAQFHVGYGQSETAGLVTLGAARERPGSAGRPMALSAVSIVDEEDRPVPSGEVGEISVRGPVVFRGYWNLPEDTAYTFRGGWHHTGDMGRFDQDGFLVYAGRSPAKELIKSGGENVYPAEVEAAIRAHPAIAEVSVIGVPDPQWHEAVKAVCVLRPGASAEAAEIIAFVGERLARYKRPKQVEFVPEMPRAASGAIDRAAVKARHGGPG
ncbi:AMP-binding protein [Enterovirga sp. CN4-39]|uniref:AMP-binding protein n=1 Tax=Enterovirga sp. CN4-39 TaxID=3400910 RepID=UPI003C101B25